MAARYYDTESGTIVTLDELREIWEAEREEAEKNESFTYGAFRGLYADGMFGAYVENCCAKNGTLVPIPENLSGKMYLDLYHMDIVDRRTAYYRLETEYDFDDFTPMSEMWEYFAEVK